MIVNVNDTFDAAMVYVMLSRVCSLEQIKILNEFDESKMYPNNRALEELERLNNISRNKNLTTWEIEDKDSIKISSLNCRSLKKHYEDLMSDSLLLKSDIIGLQETWLENDEDIENLETGKYNLIVNSHGKGKGVAAYFKKNIFKPDTTINDEHMQLSKFTSSSLDIIFIYRSQQGNYNELNKRIDQLSSKNKPLLVIGDLNFCFLEASNATKSYFEAKKFKQLITAPTHIGGHLLDHAYLKDRNETFEYSVELQSKYYTDHKGLAITLKKVN